jgi:hypothetical protein
MELNGAFGLTVISPWKQAQTKVHRCGVKTEQLVLETKFLLFTGALTATEVTQMEEDVLISVQGR